MNLSRAPCASGSDAARPVAALPLTFLATAAAAFLAAALAAPWVAAALTGHYYQPALFALTHTLTLGWITLSIIGASCQIVPAVLERPLASARAQWVAYGALLIGALGMVAHFALAEWIGLAWAAGLLAIGVLIHVVNLAVALARLPRWTFTARCTALALGGLVVTLGFGGALAINHLRPFIPSVFPMLHVHVHVALLAWVLPMVIGVAAHAYPTFLLAPEPRGWLGGLQLWGLALGVPCLAIGVLAVPGLVAPASLAVTAAIGGHLAWVAGMVRRRRQPRLDWPLRFVLTGTAGLALAATLGLGFAFEVLTGPRAAAAYGVIALGGWVSFTIAGMMLKIVPLLVWSRVYAPRVGRQSVPSVAALAWPSAERVAYALLLAGVAALALAAAAGDGRWIARAALVVAGGAVAFAAALGHALAHLRGQPPLPAVRRLPVFGAGR
jgi:hypothetical protein